MAALHVRALAPLLLLLLSACARHELRPMPCAPRIMPPPHSGLAWQSDPSVRAVRGRVVGVDGTALGGRAIAELRGESVVLHAQPVDSAGRFVFSAVDPGRYALDVRSVGYFRVGDTVRVTPDSGATVLAVLARDFAVLDACGYGHERVRLPWWRVW